MARFSTVGHSNRSFEVFRSILQSARVEVVADVRSFPRSRSNPTFNTDSLPDRLAEQQIGYTHMPALGGRRNRRPEVPDEVNAGWKNQSFHNYADYALSGEFADAFAELVALGRKRHVAIMCAEAVWWRCHRRIVADHLICAGHQVLHLMGEGQEVPARTTPIARCAKDGSVVYPAAAERPDEP